MLEGNEEVDKETRGGDDRVKVVNIKNNEVRKLTILRDLFECYGLRG